MDGMRTATARTSGTRPTGRSRTASATRAATRPPPPGERPRRHIGRRLRSATVAVSVLVLAVTGTAWGLYRGVTAGITTTDVITGGSNDGPQNILLVGVDSRTDAQGNPLPKEVTDALHTGADTGVLNSDTIIVLHVPEGGRGAVAFSIPRDSYVDIPGYRTDKINAAYPAMKALSADQMVADGVTDRKQIEAESSQKGRQALIGAVEGLTGLTIDHYAEINLLGFYNLTKAIGGVDVCLKAPVNDVLSGANFAAGPQTISGADALAFVRQRHGLPQGDLSRIRRQQVFLAAVSHKILAAGTLTDPGALSRLVGVAQQSLTIDSGWDLLAFAQQASSVAAGDLEFVTIPTKGNATNDRGDVVLVDRFAVRDAIDRKIAAQEAAATAAEAAPVKRETTVPGGLPDDVIASRYVVDVRNGSSASGMAGTVATHLGKLGFGRGTVDNDIATTQSVVRYTGSDGDAAKAVADQLGGIAVESVGSDEVTPGHLLVVIGADFAPSVVAATTQAAAPTTTTTPAPPAGGPITAAGVPCID
ncbi:MAG: cell envelope-related transcriptional attenuator [Pseudonocardia sp.]|nr:cell envelope-related transcriptional attenuator [Pseudonocardia sp.]